MLVVQRIKEVLPVRTAQGVRLGRSPSLDPEVVDRIRDLLEAGETLARIAERLPP